MSDESGNSEPPGDKFRYDPRYLAGILFFNRGDYFEAHEVWESLWRDCQRNDRRFYQGLIQAAVAIYHAIRGNRAGANRLFQSAQTYMKQYPTHFLGLDIEIFWQSMTRYWLNRFDQLKRAPTENSEAIPKITLDPNPISWPNPETVLLETEQRSAP